MAEGGRESGPTSSLSLPPSFHEWTFKVVEVENP